MINILHYSQKNDYFPQQLTSYQVSILLEEPKCSEINGWLLPKEEEAVPRFWLEIVSDHINQDPENSFWWSPWLIIADNLVVGTGSFKGSPNSKIDPEDGEVWIWQKTRANKS